MLYTGLIPLCTGLYTHVHIRVLAVYAVYPVFRAVQALCRPWHVQACISLGARLNTGLHIRVQAHIWLYRLIRVYGLHTLCVHRPVYTCIYGPVHGVCGAYPVSGLHPGLAVSSHTRYVQACNTHSRPMLYGLCIQARARAAHHWIYLWDEGSGRGRDITSCPSYRPRACGRVYTRARA